MIIETTTTENVTRTSSVESATILFSENIIVVGIDNVTKEEVKPWMQW